MCTALGTRTLSSFPLCPAQPLSCRIPDHQTQGCPGAIWEVPTVHLLFQPQLVSVTLPVFSSYDCGAMLTTVRNKLDFISRLSLTAPISVNVEGSVAAQKWDLFARKTKQRLSSLPGRWLASETVKCHLQAHWKDRYL